jgi:hypothetical protein
MTPPVPPTEHPSLDHLLQLHIAEYNALTTRNSYYIVIAASLFPVLVLVIAGMTARWKDVSHVLLIWAMGLAVQFFSLAMIDNARWQYESINYVENTLRPLIVALVGQSTFWAYERHLSKDRALPQWWEYAPAFWASAAIITAPLGRLYDLGWPSLCALPAVDWIGFGVSLLFFVKVIVNSARLMALRRSIFGRTSKTEPL